MYAVQQPSPNNDVFTSGICPLKPAEALKLVPLNHACFPDPFGLFYCGDGKQKDFFTGLFRFRIGRIQRKTLPITFMVVYESAKKLVGKNNDPTHESVQHLFWISISRKKSAEFWMELWDCVCREKVTGAVSKLLPTQ